MKKWEEIEELLLQEILEEFIEKAKPSAGIYGPWMKGSIAMEQANAIFGASGWSSKVINPPEIVHMKVGVSPDGSPRDGIVVTTVMQVTALGLDQNGNVLAISKEDVGFGTAAASWDAQRQKYLPMKPPAYRAAIMGSATIAVKRCLRQYGRALGAQLYISDEDTIAMLWAKGADGAETPRGALEPTEEGAPRKQPKRKQAAAQSTNEQMAEELGIKLTDANREVITTICAKAMKLTQLGKTPVTTKVAREQVGDKATVAEVFEQQPGHAAWMAMKALGGSRTAAFVAMAEYELFHREMGRLVYRVKGGDYEPWEGAGVRNPKGMLGARLERKVLASDDFKEALIARFADDSGEKINEFHFRGHLKAHFQVERLALITWEQLAALRAHVLEGAEYPEQWRKHEAPPAVLRSETAEALVEEETEETPHVPPADPEPGVATIRAETPEEAPPPKEPVEEEETDFQAECAKLLAEIDEKLGLEGKNTMVAQFGKAPLDTQLALNAVAGAHKAVMAESLKGVKATHSLLVTMLKPLA